MYSLNVRDHFMIAHSFQGKIFGPAQRLHGATYVVDVELRRPQLDEDGIVVDIGRARDVVRAVLSELDYRNLDEEPSLRDLNTTTEVLARTIFDRIAARAADGTLGPGGAALSSMKVILRESHLAWASYEGELAAAGR